MPVLILHDSEADGFAFFAAARRPGLDLLLWVGQPHRVVLAPNGCPSSLRAALLAASIEAPVSVPVAARPHQPQREARLSLRRVWGQVCPPQNAPPPKPAPVGLWAVAALEEEPPEGASGSVWFLLTPLVVAHSATAVGLIQAYAYGDRIEQCHYVLKSGLGFERVQVDTLLGLQKALSLLSIVAWRLLYGLYLARHKPQTPAEEAVCLAERHVLERVEAAPRQTVAPVVLAVAKRAGFRPLPSAPTPGVKSLWLGWRKLADVLLGYQLATSRPAP